MILAISSSGTDLSSAVDPRFGRCRYLVFYDTDSGSLEAVANSNIDAAGGAGIRTAQMVLDKGAGAVITGNVGPNAMNVLSGGGVPVYTGVSGTVESAVKLYEEGSLTATGGPTAAPHSGMAGGGGMPGGAPGGGMGMGGAMPGGMPGGGMGMGMGMGGGMGMGMGRGMGMGMGMGRGMGMGMGRGGGRGMGRGGCGRGRWPW